MGSELRVGIMAKYGVYAMAITIGTCMYVKTQQTDQHFPTPSSARESKKNLRHSIEQAQKPEAHLRYPHPSDQLQWLVQCAGSRPGHRGNLGGECRSESFPFAVRHILHCALLQGRWGCRGRWSRLCRCGLCRRRGFLWKTC